MNKVIIGIVVVLLVAIAGAGVYLLQNLDGIVKDLIEEVGTDVTKTQVKVSGVSIKLTEGSATISGLTIANPPGFSAEPLFSLGSINVVIDTGSLTGPVYVINEINVSGVDLLAEQKGVTTNVQVLMDGMETTEQAAAPADANAASSDVLLAIGQINFDDGTMELRSDQFETQNVALKQLRLNNLGSADNGLTPEQLGAEVGAQLMKQVQDAVSAALSQYVRKKAESAIKEKLGDLFKRD